MMKCLSFSSAQEQVVCQHVHKDCYMINACIPICAQACNNQPCEHKLIFLLISLVVIVVSSFFKSQKESPFNSAIVLNFLLY